MENKAKTILVADDENDIIEIISYNLTGEGYEVHTAKDGKDALEKARELHPDLIILDVLMPYKSGVEICHLLRSNKTFDNTLIILLTALSDDSSHIKGLEAGADDYITKPISPKVLVSRVNTLFRRTGKTDNEVVVHDNITVDPERFLVIIDNEEISLAKKEFELLYLLAAKPGRVFLRNEILNQVWGNSVIVGDRTIDVHIRKIRQKMGVDCIKTVKGVGYKFEL